VRLIRGAPGAGKTALVFREFKEAFRSGRGNARIVVPTATLVRHFQHELARDGMVFPPSAVISLSRFAQECAPGKALIPDGVLRAMVRDSLRRLRPPEFAEVADAGGMVEIVLETIALFENANWTPDRLAGVRKLSAHAKAFQKLWMAVDAAVTAAGFRTRAGMLRAADTTGLKFSKIWLDGFQNLSPLEEHFIAGLNKSCDLAITLTDSRSAEQIYRFALQSGAQDRLLPGSPRRPVPETASASAIEREADEIALRLLKLNERGTPFREMGVALREPSIYVPLLKGTFERFGVPARFHFSAPLSKQPAATFLGGLIECVLNGWEFSAALETFQAHPAWGQSAAFDRFDFRVREEMPGAGAEALLKIAEPDFARRIEGCFGLHAWRELKARPGDWAARFEAMARNLYRPGLLEPTVSQSALEVARSLTAALGSWIDAVVSAAGFWQESEGLIALQDFWDVAREVVDGTALHLPDDRREAVNVMSAFEARQWDLSTLFVCGFTDRDFPRRNVENPIFPDADIESLRLPIRKKSDRDNDEKFLWESLRTRAKDRLLLSWPRHDAGGNSVQCSRFACDLEITVHAARPCRATPALAFDGSGTAGRISDPGLLASLTTLHQRLSLSSLEDMAQCRFKFFANRTLSLKPRPERPDERLQKRIGGLILHEALEAWLNNGRQGDFVDLFEIAFDKMVREKRLPQGFRLEMERILLREIARTIKATEQWTPISSQAEVDLTLSYPDGVTVTCRVDRIDRMSENDCVIVDYKSGKTANVEKLIQSKVKLQGPLYALAAKEQLNLNTIAMMYVAVREDERFGWGSVPGTDLGLVPIPVNWMEDARQRSVERLSGFLSGAVQAEPAEEDGCRWCDFRNACRVEQKEARTMTGGAAHGG